MVSYVIVSLISIVAGFFVLLFLVSEKDAPDIPYLSFIGIILIVVGLRCMYLAGEGELGSETLSVGEVREVVCTVPISGKFGALLKKPDGGLEARKLSKDPPKYFVVVDDANNPYAPYPAK